ncbi:bifunctional diguanylate cyclase/phosphodiesterase [Teichococcus vastitatis]|uniref:bifunctional diguanylate cyclase/phosphodiesterase n=1 Tax=Teichococcus vastitatis TaxID=2307076 RepID=UPI000E72D481|nr:bifunctional diguanylate cyclase/phosphodiesterase [Pseudoroseomonas vastitatis]
MALKLSEGVTRLDAEQARQTFLAEVSAGVTCALQPIVETATGRLHGYEALLRGHDRLGFATPIDLLDQAATLGVLAELEALVQRRALAAFTPLRSAAVGGPLLFLNIDPRLPAETALAGLAHSVAAAGLPAGAVCVEISERLEEQAEVGMSAVLRRLQEQGHRIAVDDFGRGAARLGMLAEGQADYVKIDRRFITGLGEDPRRQLIVSGIAAMARRLGLRVVAEGVENRAEFLACCAAGCDLAQGYFIARPTLPMAGLSEGVEISFPHLPQPAVIGRGPAAGRPQDAAQLLAAAERPQPVRDDAEAETLFALFRNNPELDVYPVVTAECIPCGLVHERTLREYVYSPFGRSLLQNPAMRFSARRFARPCPVVEADAGADRALEAFAASPQAAGVILTRNNRYLGVLSAQALLSVLHERRLRQARDQSPLTGLPGNHSIAARVETLGLSAQHARYLCYFDLDNFKAFNDRYGFRRGDRAIELLAEHLRRGFPESDTFLGHVGGDDFFAGLERLDSKTLRKRLAALLEGFAQEAAGLHDAADRAAGGLHGHDRSGTARFFPLLCCSVAAGRRARCRP